MNGDYPIHVNTPFLREHQDERCDDADRSRLHHDAKRAREHARRLAGARMR